MAKINKDDLKIGVTFVPCSKCGRVEVVHGRWIKHPDDLFPADSTPECSVCHEHEYFTLINEKYCPNCGAKMDGDGNAVSA